MMKMEKWKMKKKKNVLEMKDREGERERASKQASERSMKDENFPNQYKIERT
jgi:hypothetical protein